MVPTSKYTPFTTLSIATRYFCNSKSGYSFRFNGKENDKETYGEGNAMDFGARIYDCRLGRWMSVDALTAKYPDLSPYNFSVNSPILLKDFDGKDFIVTISKDDKGKTLITLTATIYVAGATKAQIREMNRLAAVYLKPGTTDNAIINFNVQFKALPANPSNQLLTVLAGELLSNDLETKLPKGSKGKDGVNILFITNTNSSSSRVFTESTKPTNFGVLDSRKAIDTETLAREAFHESLHFLGLSDRYSESTKPKVDPSDGQTKSARVTSPNPGFENDFMGSTCASSFNQIHYENIANKFSKEKGKIEYNTRNKGFIDKDSKGNPKGKAKP